MIYFLRHRFFSSDELKATVNSYFTTVSRKLSAMDVRFLNIDLECHFALFSLDIARYDILEYSLLFSNSNYF